MNASGEFLASASPRTLFGLRVCDLGWNATLGLVESLIALRGNRTTIGFFDERTAFRQMIDPAYRSQLGRRVLLPGGGRAFSILAKARHEKPTPVRFSAAMFVPALLSFLERGIASALPARIPHGSKPSASISPAMPPGMTWRS
ncbi:hypothetical protein LZK73_04520 [Neorhizobium galegae]|nr:hypothetical protein LZK73_04520 [Neorhizobium galegae]